MNKDHQDIQDTPLAVEFLASEYCEPRPMRADAAKNHEKILKAAEEIFALDGVGVPIDIVAERAGVGIGTLYRHFPTKEALYEAIVMTRLSELIATADEYATNPDPQEGLCSFLHEFARQASEKHDLFDALGQAGIDVKARFSDLVEDLVVRIDGLRQRAVDAGSLRDDVSTKDIMALVVGSCHAAGQGGAGDASLDRLLEIILAGLQPQANR
jgi:AcrR family transcriptional regulator